MGQGSFRERSLGRKEGMSMRKERQNPVKLVIIGCILAALIIGFYFYLSNKTRGNGKEDNPTLSKSQQVLLRNLETNYPPSPREVLKYYCDILQCLYNESHTDEELEDLAMQIQRLYDGEFIANQNADMYLLSLAGEIANMEKNDMKISSYSTSSSTDVDYFTEDNYDWARLYCILSIRKGTQIVSSEERFLMRKDEDGHWKIYGWELVEE